ncbi:hypothetical protein IWQ56_001937 [Coemansia nantahalensis]|nr:hypothetical protein IWQ56_001937 [Coemansia nantahalensis]
MDELQAKWADLKRLALMSPSHLRALAFAPQPAGAAVPLRSLRWRLWLDALPIEQFGEDDDACWRVWSVAAESERRTYAGLKAQFVVDPSAGAEGAADVQRMHPLSLDEDSPWSQFHRDQELRRTIQQDVARTFPDEAYFGAARVQRLLADVLLVYARMHSALGYRQGMHELLAPLLMAVDRDAVDCVGGGSGCRLASVLDRRFVEHDAFALFGRLMRLCAAWYQVPSLASPPAAPRVQTPIVAQCHLMLDKLALVDPRLGERLRGLDIEPQLFGIRWYRLLFSRELARLDDVCALWDVLFADSAAGPLRLVDWVAVVVLLANRRRLLHGDYEECLTTLLHLPPLPLPAPEALERTPPLQQAAAAPPLLADAAVLAPKIPYAALALPATTPVQRLALQAAYLRSRPTVEAAALVARQYELWEEEAWDVVDDVVPPPPAKSRTPAQVSPLPVAVPQARKARAQGAAQQQTHSSSLPSPSPRSPRSTFASPPVHAGGAVPLTDRRAAQPAPEFYGAVRSPGEAAMALGSATAQVASMAAQCLDMAADGADGGRRAVEDVAAALHALARVWQDEVVRSADGRLPAAAATAATAEADLREVLCHLDRVHVRLSPPAQPDHSGF